MNDNPVRLSEPERDRTAVDRLSLQAIRFNVRYECEARSKDCGSNFEFAVFYLNIRVRADIEVFSSPFPNKIVKSFWESRALFSKRALEKIPTQTNSPINTNLFISF